MARLYLVRHGRAAAGFGESMDPGLDVAGNLQAEAVARRLAPLGPLPILSSPLARAQETAAPLARLWSRTPSIETGVAEIPSPSDNLQDRVAWLRSFMAGSWQHATPLLASWRQNVIATLLSFDEDVVIFSHYIAINVAVGLALGDPRVVVFSPNNCSVTILGTATDSLVLIEKGEEAPLTKVN